ncbi:Uncharacterized protein SCF082_LOCUS14603 [Durusdinium trenchii]|uniref:Uncharacterized protein n=1 Tax=Durusdinium trenchii TaxID=1381693 RepID=A0ABP0K0D3_9DINO
MAPAEPAQSPASKGAPDTELVQGAGTASAAQGEESREVKAASIKEGVAEGGHVGKDDPGHDLGRDDSSVDEEEDDDAEDDNEDDDEEEEEEDEEMDMEIARQIVPGDFGVSLEYLLELAGDDREKTTHDILDMVQSLGAGRSGGTGLSFVEFLQADEERAHLVGPANMFVCQSWDESLHDSLIAIQEQFVEVPSANMNQMFVWLDVFCINYFELADAKDAGVNFMHVLDLIQDIIVVIDNVFVIMLDWDPVTQSSRMWSEAWTCWAVCHAPLESVNIVLNFSRRREILRMIESSPDRIVGGILAVDCKTATCADELEQSAIFADLGGRSVASMEDASEHVRSVLFRWLAVLSLKQLQSKQDEIERAYPDPFARNEVTGGKSLRNLLRRQAIYLYRVVDALVEDGEQIVLAIQIFQAVIDRHEKFRGQINYDETHAANLCRYGDLFERINKYEDALKIFQVAEKFSRAVAPSFLGDTYQGQATCLWELGLRDNAFEAHANAVKYFADTLEKQPNGGNRRNLAHALMQYGHHLRLTEEQDDKGIELLEEGLKHAVVLFRDDQAEETLVELRELGATFWEKGEFKRAAQKYEQLLSLLEVCERTDEGALCIDLEEYLAAAPPQPPTPPRVSSVASASGGVAVPPPADARPHQLKSASLSSLSSAPTHDGSDLGHDLRSFARCLLDGTGPAKAEGEEDSDEEVKALKEAAMLSRAACDIDLRMFGSLSGNVISDLKLLVHIERRNGKLERAALLQAKIHKLREARSSNQDKDALEAEVPVLLQRVNEVGNFEEVAGKLEALSASLCKEDSWDSTPALQQRSLGYLLEATKLRLVALQGGTNTQATHERVVENMVACFRLFGRINPDQEVYIRYCENFCKLVAVYYRDDPKNENTFLASRQYAELLAKLRHYEDAKGIFMETLAIGKRIYGPAPHKEMIDCMRGLAAILKKTQMHPELLDLQSRICRTQEALQDQDGDQLAADLFALAEAHLAAPADTPGAAETEAITALERAAELLQDAARGADSVENLSIIRRKLAQQYYECRRLDEAAQTMTSVIGAVEGLLGAEDDDSDTGSESEITAAVRAQLEEDNAFLRLINLESQAAMVPGTTTNGQRTSAGPVQGKSLAQVEQHSAVQKNQIREINGDGANGRDSEAAGPAQDPGKTTLDSKDEHPENNASSAGSRPPELAGSNGTSSTPTTGAPPPSPDEGPKKSCCSVS